MVFKRKSYFIYRNRRPFYYEQDPAKTVWQVGDQHYLLQSEYVDKNTQAKFKNMFEYENCSPGDYSKTSYINQNLAPESTNPVNRIKPSLRLPQKDAIEKFKQLKSH